MATTVADAFIAAGLVRSGLVQWGQRLPSKHSGVYIVSLSKVLDDTDAALKHPPLARGELERWLSVCPMLTMDGLTPTLEALYARVESFWIADEVVLYIGLATNLSERLSQYYRTPIGAPKPHSGGCFLKLLSSLSKLWIHYADCDNFDVAESAMLKRFCTNVSEESRRALRDSQHPFPFANLEWPRGIRKAHGLNGMRWKVAPTEQKQVTHPMPTRGDNSMSLMAGHRTQRITVKDMENGRVRIPAIGAAETKQLFPDVKAKVDVVLRGKSISCSWNPNMGPDRERSGVLGVSRTILQQLVRANEVLGVTRSSDGRLTINDIEPTASQDAAADPENSPD
jgi:hypothetical protein